MLKIISGKINPNNKIMMIKNRIIRKEIIENGERN